MRNGPLFLSCISWTQSILQKRDNFNEHSEENNDMKTVFRRQAVLVLHSLLFILPWSAPAATNDLTSLLQQGLFEEEADRNLDAAITNYQSLAAKFDQDRQIAATAVFRLGECYRKLGRTNEAVVQYERIVREFPDQTALATLSRQNLVGLGGAPPGSAPAAAIDESTAALAQAAAAAEVEAASLRAQMNRLLSLSNSDVRAIVQHNYPDPVLTKLMQDLADAQQKLVSLELSYNADHPTYRNAKKVVQAIDAQIENQVKGVLAGLKEKMDAALDNAENLRARLEQLRRSQPKQSPAAGLNPPAASTDDEDQEIRRIQAMIQNSPDLINSAASGATPLCQAASAGQFRVVTFLLDHGANINLKSRVGTPLHGATSNGNKAMVELLLDRGADVNATDGTGGTALHIAAENGFLAVAEVLLGHYADVNARNSQANGERTPLHRAAARGNVEVLKLLIARGADINAKATDGSTPLGDAVGSGQLDSVKALLAAKADPDIADNKGRTPLSEAVRENNLEIVKTLLDAKADPNEGKLDAPLFCAIKGGNTNMVELLLRSGANPNLPGRLGRWLTGYVSDQTSRFSPLEFSMTQDQPAITRLLLQFKADPNGKDTSKQPFIFHALLNLDILKAMLDAGADANKTNAYGESVLMYVAHSPASGNSVEAAKLLLAHGACVNAHDALRNTPLHMAAWNAYKEMVALLIANKAEVNTRNDAGTTPLDLAKQGLGGSIDQALMGWNPPARSPTDPAKQREFAAQQREVVELLRQHGALDDLPNFDRIEISRQSSGYRSTAFIRGTNDWNHFTLLELLAYQYQFLRTSRQGATGGPGRTDSSFWWRHNDWRFPDLSRVVIRRPSREGKSRASVQIDVAKILEMGDCSLDPQLQWGDVVEIPEADHPVDERWDGLRKEYLDALFKCISRSVTVSIKGTNATMVLRPQYEEEGKFRTDYKPLMVGFMQCALRSVLDQSHLLRESSDLSRVKVTRVDPATGKKRQWVLDCSGNNAPDLWLRDGDVIQVPEK